MAVTGEQLEPIKDAERGRFKERLAQMSAHISAFWRFIIASARADSGQLFLWTPVAIGAGAGFYFSLAEEPAFWIAPLCAALLASVMFLVRPRPKTMRAGLLAAILMATGFCAADLRTRLVAAPVLKQDLTPRLVTGALVSVGEGARGRRLVVKVSAIERFDGAKPYLVRLNWRGDDFDALPGDIISLRAGLSPPPPPVAPGAFDFARQLYFQRIGAVGYAVSPPQVLPHEKRSLVAAYKVRIEKIRLFLARRIAMAAPGEGGAIVAAVVTGKREAISERAKNALRDSGLAHLLAISGLHMGLATGLIFFGLRAGLALCEPLALRFPIKKWAALGALGAGFFYLLLSGGGWSARRAFIMTAVIFIAILADRRALSLRNVALAASFILLTTPEALLHPGFQMSFAAVTALIAAYEWWAGRPRADDRAYDLGARLKRYAVGVGVTDTIAAVATAPFALYHFHRVAIYSLPANLAAMPLMAFWIMPFAVIALLLTPLGLDLWAWRASAMGVDLVIGAASLVSSQPGAVGLTQHWPLAALLAIVFGALFLCLQKQRWRYGGLACLPLAMMIAVSARPPDLFIARSGENAGLVVENDKGGRMLAMFDRRKSRFEARAWREYAGLDGAGSPLRFTEIGLCDAYGCVAEGKTAARDRETNMMTIAISQSPDGLYDDCARASLVIALYPAPARHKKACAATLIDRRDVWREGAHAVWFEPDGALRIKTVNERRGARPWTGGG